MTITKEDSGNNIDIISMLFKDVSQMPMITNRWQEKWLGIQIRAEYWINSFSKEIDESLDSPNYIKQITQLAYKKLVENSIEFEQLYEKSMLDINYFYLGILFTELVDARKRIYDIHYSRLRNVLQQISSVNNYKKQKELLNLIYNILELTCLFPNSLINYIVDFEQELERLPNIKEIKARLASNDHIEYYVDDLRIYIINARDILIKGYLRYPLRISEKYVNKGLDYLDLVQEGFIGLLKAAKRYNHREDGKFVHYASMWIWQALGRTLAYDSRTIRLPVYLHEKIVKLDEAFQYDLSIRENLPFLIKLIEDIELLPKNEVNIIREYLNENIKQKTTLPTEVFDNIRTFIGYLKPIIPLETSIPEYILEKLPDLKRDFLSEKVLITDIIPDNDSVSPIELVNIKITRDILYQAINDLPTREKSIIELRYGLRTSKAHTLDELGVIHDLTRERIRQILKKILIALKIFLSDKLLSEKIIKLEEPITYLPYRIQCYFEDKLVNNENLDRYHNDKVSLSINKLLEKLPGGKLFGRNSGSHITRPDQLYEAMGELGAPSHYSAITEQLNDMIGDELRERYVYILLNKYDDRFLLLGEGVFSLIKWERERINKTEQILPFCPSLPIDLPNEVGTFLDTVIILKDLLEERKTVKKFLEIFFNLLNQLAPQPRWIKQSIMNIYYLVGLIPYTFFYDGNVDLLENRLPKLNISELRKFCASAFINRLVSMREFLWIFQRFQPINSIPLGDRFLNFHPYGLNDTSNRLKVLVSLGVAQKSAYGEYQLTLLGEELSNKYKKKPNIKESEEEIRDHRMGDSYNFEIIDFNKL